jgi:hypothetical protein
LKSRGGESGFGGIEGEVVFEDAEGDVEEFAHDCGADGFFGFAAGEEGLSPA